MDMAMQNIEQPMENCWKRIGVWGQEEPRCPILQQVIHCRNCKVFTRAGRNLLERDLPRNYEKGWSQVFAEKKEEELPGTVSVLIFRIAKQWFALPAQLLEEVITPQPLHTVPHRDKAVLKGVINVHGEIRLCVSLKALLDLENHSDEKEEQSSYRRMIVVNKDENRWVFPVDEIHGILRVHPQMFENVPVTVAKAKTAFTKHLFKWEGTAVALLDDELLLYRLRRSVQ
jgi:chemotaxis-related protein WspD